MESTYIITRPGDFTGTAMHPAIAVLTIVSFVLITCMNVRNSLFLIIFLSIMTPMGQKIEVFGLNFPIFRLLILAGWVKILFNHKLKIENIERTDKVIIYWVIVSFIIYIIQQYNMDAVINRLGFAYNAVGIYFLYRILVKRTEDINTVCNTLAIVSAFVAVCMLIEQWTGRNLFYVFGGVEKFTPVRMGRLRSQGPFAHAINAGVFGATMFPIYFSMWRHKWGSAVFGIIGTLSACVLVVTSASATPLITFVSGFAALLFWPLRNYMSTVRYGILFLFVVLQIIIITPIWSFIKEFDIIKGASGLHRFMLVDNLINRFGEWYIIGVSSTSHWGLGMQDRANQYYAEAVSGGLLKLGLFILIIVYCFKNIGKNIITVTDNSARKKLWALGSALFANIIAFVGISYWDQMLFVWYLFLALITSTCLINGEKPIGIDEMSIKSENQ